jgi:formate hydrogenlyase subunit 3/multisubunit Na+/H+ antiporter MnhD subunit
MSAPIIWIGIPFLISILIWFFRKNRPLIIYITSGFCILLAVAALSVKFGEVFSLGPLTLEINTTFTVLGRSFILQDSERFIVALLYFSAGIWFAAARISGSNEFFLPHGLAVISFLIAALTVQPFLYAALFVEIAVLLSIPMLIKSGEEITDGVLRFLVFQTLAVPFVLLAGWAFEQAPFSTNSQLQFFQASIFLGLGFAFWLAIFPFHAWVPMVAEEGQPYVFAFLISMISTSILVLSMDFFNSYSWLRNEPVLLQSIQIIGTIMVVFGGVFGAFQKRLSRLIGYAYIYEIGFSLVSIGITTEIGWQTLIYSFIPRIFSMMVLALGVAVLINNFKTDQFEEIRGLFYKSPFIAIATILAWFSMAGLPLLGSFPIKMTILSEISSTSILYTIWIVIGLAGSLFMGGRLLSIFFVSNQKTTVDSQIKIQETTAQAVFLSIESVILIILGFFPSIFITIMMDVLNAYTNLY